MQGACCLLGTGTVRLRIASPVMVMRGRNLSLALEKGVSWMQRPDQSSPVVVCLTVTSEAYFGKRWNKHSCPSLFSGSGLHQAPPHFLTCPDSVQRKSACPVVAGHRPRLYQQC